MMEGSVLLQFGVLAGVSFIVLGLGFVPPLQRTPTAAVLSEVVAHGFAWLCIVLGLLFWVPRMGHVFADFGAELPLATQMLLKLSTTLRRGGLLFFLGLILGSLTLDGVVTYGLWQKDDNRPQRWLWSLLMTAIPLAVIVAGGLTLMASVLRLLNELS